jgi:hypothetical protein
MKDSGYGNATVKALARHARKTQTRKQQRSKKRSRLRGISGSFAPVDLKDKMADRGPWTGA